MKRFLLLALLALVFVPSAVSKPRAAELLLSAAVPGRAVATAAAPGPFTYHSGKLMKTQIVRNVYWQPAGFSYGPTYQGLVDRFLNDVAADSGKQSNVFSVMTQYGNSSGPISYALTFAGATVDTSAYPPPSPFCVDPYTSYCVEDKAIQNRLNALIAANGWAKDFSTAYTVYLPQNVGARWVGGYAYQNFCAYHKWVNYTGSSSLIYSVIPYGNWSGKCLPGSTPSNDPSGDSAVNSTSHELIEVFTDPNGHGWYGSGVGDEIADRCNKNFGSPTGSNEFGFYNQIINGNPYELQGEWSNETSGCAWSR